MNLRFLLMMLALGLCACAPDAGSRGNRVRLGWAGSPDALNPGKAVLAQAYTIFGLVYDALYAPELDGSFSPRLVEDRTLSDDGKTWIFHIRAGMRFHDGYPLTAHDVAFSLNLYHRHAEFPLLHSYTRHFSRILATDDHTVALELTEPIPNIESQLAFLWILPKHIWEGRDAIGFDNAGLIGSGPFKKAGYRQNAFVHLSVHEDHPLAPRHIDGVIFQTFANQDALVQAIRTGQVDAILEMPFTAVSSLRAQPHIHVVSGTPVQPETTNILINQRAPEHSGGSGHPALRDPRVRRALAMAVDKQRMIDVVLLGLGRPGLTLVPEGLGDWYNRDLVDYPLDVERARMLLTEAGFVDRDGDGVRRMPDGRPLRLRINWPSDSPIAPRLARMLADMWTAIGVQTQLQALDPDALTAICCPAFDYDVIVWGWTTASDPGFLLDVMTSGGIATGANETGYSNPDYDALYWQQATELDPERRRRIVYEMQRMVHKDVVYIVPFYPMAVQAYRTDRFSGWVTHTPRLGLETVQALSALAP